MSISILLGNYFCGWGPANWGSPQGPELILKKMENVLKSEEFGENTAPAQGFLVGILGKNATLHRGETGGSGSGVDFKN